MRLIDANEIVYMWQVDADGQEHDGVTLQSIIRKMPTIETERKTGRWIRSANYTYEPIFEHGHVVNWIAREETETIDGLPLPLYYCSVCKVGHSVYTNGDDKEIQFVTSKYVQYCPFCGAHMVEVEHET